MAYLPCKLTEQPYILLTTFSEKLTFLEVNSFSASYIIFNSGEAYCGVIKPVLEKVTLKKSIS